jgi:predicted transcriptional regulator
MTSALPWRRPANTTGSFRFEPTRVGRDTVLAQIVRLVQEAQGSKAPIQRLAEPVTSYFVPAVLGFVALTFVAWFVFGPEPGLQPGVAQRGRGAHHRRYLRPWPGDADVDRGRERQGRRERCAFRNAEALERLHNVRAVVLDKTGILTEGKPRVTDVLRTTDALAEHDLVRLVASAERGSEHPPCEAIVRSARDEQGLDPPEMARSARLLAGKGRAVTRTPRLEDVLGPLAAAIVRQVGARGEASVGSVVEALRRSQQRERKYTTVMTVMGRLHEKGVLERERRGRQYIYRPTASEAELIDRLSALAVDRLIDRYGMAALRHFGVRLADLDPETRRRLAALADTEK